MKEKLILVIEDEDDVRTSIQDILENAGYKVILASDGKSGVKLAKSSLPDLIVSDIMMPGMDGYSVIKALNKTKKTSLIPFLFLSAKASMDDLRFGMNLGADDYLIKPFRAKDLVEAISSRLKKREDILAKSARQNQSEISRHPESKAPTDRIFINYNNSMRLIKFDDIIYIKAEGSYTEIATSSKKYIVRKPLKNWEEILSDNTFIRIHRSTIINTNYFLSSKPAFKRSYNIFLQNINEPLVLSERYVKKIRNSSIISSAKSS